MNSSKTKLFATLFALFLLAYVGYQTFLSFYDPYETEVVTMDEYVHDIDLNGFFVRDEAVLGTIDNGVIGYNYQDAQKVSNDAVVANIYSEEKDLEILNQTEILKKQKEILEDAQNRENIEGLKLDLINNQISMSKLELLKQINENSFEDIEQVHDALMLNMDKVAVFLDDTVSYEETITSLNAKIEELEASAPTPTDTFVTNNSGYFSGYVDGLETLLTPGFLTDLSVASIKSRLAQPAKEQTECVGKIVTNNHWYFVSLVPAKEAEVLDKLFQTRRTVTLKFSSKSIREIEVSIERVILPKEGDETGAVVFESDYLDEDLINLRFETPKVIVDRYQGVIIPQAAVRLQDAPAESGLEETEDRVKGVYTLLGDTVRFKKLDIIFEDDHTVVSRQNVSASYVSVYDRVILKGKVPDNDT